MVVDAVFFVGRLYVNFITNHQTLLLLAFVLAFTALAFFVGFNRAALSRTALMNTFTTFAILALNIAFVPIIFVASTAMLAAYKSLGIPSVPGSYWSHWHWLPVALLALVVRDLADYWSHRAMHTKLGWPIHAVHHSDTHVNGFTTFRVHVLEVLVMKVFHIGFLTWLGIPAETVAATQVFVSLHNAYVHFEVDIDHGPFNWIVASPRFHRWHHADFKPAYGKNLANIIPAWDILFGTYYRAEACDKKMGAESEGIPGTDPARLILLPFVLWSRMAQTALARFLTVRQGHAPGALIGQNNEIKK